ncbi:hypothetical protein E2C01_090602 [Portunus trituberculatus]|uniref:Uncharacterized protein n=1 Tax=Portunus trituberculatus TaxID=210409 RepID=A0A5B7JLT1_PORTR|nr:hypothetical protein [Portunus trituberculatus]
MDEVALRRSGGDLALIQAGISLLQVVNHEKPILGSWRVACGEAIIRSVGEGSHGQQVHVPVANP